MKSRRWLLKRGGALAEMLETAKVQHKEDMERIYGEKQPKLVLGQRHESSGLSGREEGSAVAPIAVVAAYKGVVLLALVAGLGHAANEGSCVGSATGSKPSSPTARSNECWWQSPRYSGRHGACSGGVDGHVGGGGHWQHGMGGGFPRGGRGRGELSSSRGVSSSGAGGQGVGDRPKAGR